MPKLKTHKATAKRFTFTKKGKIQRRKTGQDHFNARESSRTTMRKRRDSSAAKADVRKIRNVLPYH
ncbi:MAG: 50S ribosomal protein L35 [Candidatus Nomurabacteria bacterium]|nr:MAG: 50S ribosomal protein L35 [Candidatus Nomurabacteria bacterium]